MNHSAANNAAAHNGNMDHSNAGTGGHESMHSSPGAAAAEYDLQFLDTMIAHHEGAVEMARPALSKDGRPELREMAKNIVADQEKEIAQLKQWREQWFPGKPPAVNMEMPGMHESMTGMDMKKLESLSGTEFDLEFIRQMRPHHAGALVMAKDALEKSKRPEIKTLANQIIQAQEKEIKQMADWEAKWTK